jgi:hypothetical protein
LAYAEIVCRPDVEPAELEHQMHLGGPGADPADAGEPLDQLLVASSRRAGENHRPVQHLGGKVAQRGKLVRREPGCAQVRIRDRVQALRGQRTADGSKNTAVDRAGGSACQLLVDDCPDERAERSLGIPRLVTDRADAGDQAAKNRVSGGDLVDCLLE